MVSLLNKYYREIKKKGCHESHERCTMLVLQAATVLEGKKLGDLIYIKSHKPPLNTNNDRKRRENMRTQHKSLMVNHYQLPFQKSEAILMEC